MIYYLLSPQKINDKFKLYQYEVRNKNDLVQFLTNYYKDIDKRILNIDYDKISLSKEADRIRNECNVDIEYKDKKDKKFL